MFNSVDNTGLTIILVIISGIQEVLVRSCMEWKEVTARKLLGSKPLAAEQMLQKRMYYAYTNTMRLVTILYF